jgi:hypothetical protein
LAENYLSASDASSKRGRRFTEPNCRKTGSGCKLDGLTRTIDFLPVLKDELYGPLREPGFFSKVALDPEVHTLVWPNGADFDPATLHDWPDVADDFTALAKRWAETRSSEAS